MQNATDPSATPTGGTPVGGYDVRTGRAGTRHRWRWLWTLLVGLGLWILCVVVTRLTRNPNLIPADILIGSFMVPVAAVAWNFDHRADSYLPLTRIFYAFVVGGTLGVLGAAVLEALFGWVPGPFQFVFVGLIEEAAKLAALIVVAQRLQRYTTTDGLVLGATVGFGFAALESAGYAFTSLFTEQGLALQGLIQTVILRGLLAPLGHGLWTAVLGMFLFHAAERRNRLRISGALVGMYFAMAGLHFLWDSSDWLAGAIAGAAVGDVFISIFFDLVVGAAGLVVLFLTWNALVRQPRQQARWAAASGSQTAVSTSWQQQARPNWPPQPPPPPAYSPGRASPPPGTWPPPGQAPDYGTPQPPAQPPPGSWPPPPPQDPPPQAPYPGYTQPPPANPHPEYGQPPSGSPPMP